MPPIPCAHCGINFMNPFNGPDSPKLCNNCLIREETRNPKKVKMDDSLEILIKCPKNIHSELEEYCINNGIDFSTYFVSLYYKTKEKFSDQSSEPLKNFDEKIRKSKK